MNKYSTWPNQKTQMKHQKTYRPFRASLAVIALGAAGLIVYQANQHSDTNITAPSIKSRVSHRDATAHTAALSKLQPTPAEPASPVLSKEIPLGDEPHQVFQKFNDWAVSYSKATPAQQKEMLADGQKMVMERHEQMANLIEKSPQAALDEADAFSPLVRESLPDSLRTQLEQPVNARADLTVTAYLGDNTVPYERTAILEDGRYTVFPAAEDEIL
jgi:hypothetical protein